MISDTYEHVTLGSTERVSAYARLKVFLTPIPDYLVARPHGP